MSPEHIFVECIYRETAICLMNRSGFIFNSRNYSEYLKYQIIYPDKKVNSNFYILCLCFFIFSLGCFKCGKGKDSRETQVEEPVEAFENTVSNSLMEDFITAVSDLQGIFPEEKIPDPLLFQSMIDSICDALKEKGKENFNTPLLADSIINIVYKEWDITFDPDQEKISSLLPHMLVLQKKGSCLGVSLLFLLIAEKLDYPIYGVLLPGHFFVRYDDGKTYRNIEPNKKGYSHPSAYYRRRYNVDDNCWYTMKNLSREETAAVLYFNIANICLKMENFSEAKKYYNKTIKDLDGFPEAWGNLAIAHVSCGENDSAGSSFRQAYTLCPKLKRLAQNIGAFELGLDRYSTALEAYQGGLYYFPDDPELFYGIAYAYYSMGKPDSSLHYLKRIGIPKDTTTREFKLARLIKEKQEK